MNERQIFLASLEIDDPAARAAYIDQACGDNEQLRQQVEELFRSSEQASKFLETPVAASDSAFEETLMSDSPSEDDPTTTGEAEFRKYLKPTDRDGLIGRLGHYDIESILGRGAFGIVAKAFDTKLHRVVAIKMMSPDLASTSPPRKRFLREARTAAAVPHENIVSIHAVEDEPIPYIVMEYVSGHTLQQRMNENGPFDVEDVLRIGQQIASGLAAAHAVNLIHRDIKPSNILLSDGPVERVKISDFGLARAVDDASMTQSGVIAGTPMYMAPEQARGESLDRRTDLFSLGSVLYQMTSGRPPFRAASTVAVLKRVCEDEPRPIPDVIPETPQWLCELISRLMEKDREVRFSNAQEVAEILTTSGRALHNGGKVTSLSGGRTPSKKIAAVTPKKPNSSRFVVLIAIFMVLVTPLLLLFAPTISSWTNTPIPSLTQNKPTGGLQFDGKDDYVEVNGINWNYPQFTIEAFVTSATYSDNGTIVFLGSDGNSGEWMSLFDGGHTGQGERISGAAVKGKTPYENAYGPFVGGERQHRALVYDGRYLNYYINGIWQGQRRAEPNEGLQWNMKELRIGCDGGGRRFFQGAIDQLRISRVVRYSDNFDVAEVLSSDEKTLVCYRFDEGTGHTLKDLSGNGLDGKIVGAKWIRSTGHNSDQNNL
ncbi:protein kinase [Thalassoglobus sp. JC818]|uniref:protein kinase domain-containing protein n=1 Tax=Thalassoglobus sp. JC818 TaxID=3232136 RepID=UPI00345962CA